MYFLIKIFNSLGYNLPKDFPGNSWFKWHETRRIAAARAAVALEDETVTPRLPLRECVLLWSDCRNDLATWAIGEKERK